MVQEESNNSPTTSSMNAAQQQQQQHQLPRNNIRFGRNHIFALVTVSLVFLCTVPSRGDRFLRVSNFQVHKKVDMNAVSATNTAISDPFLLQEQDTLYPADADADADAAADDDVISGTTAISDPFVLQEQNTHPADVLSGTTEKGLKIAWLMSFPNSGTSYTTQMIRHLAQSNTASNYGFENLGHSGVSLPVYADQPTGPFWSDPTIHPEYHNPNEFVLTKTHCGSRCIECGPYQYVETTFSFLNRCLEGSQVTLKNKAKVKEVVTYPSDKVAKAVHLIRNPFDNVVSRYHLELHPGKTAADYERTREGFRSYCEEMNKANMFEETQALFLDKVHLEILAKVPCRSDFIRYIQWHNLAFSTSHDLGLDVYVLHYDWYATRFNETAKELLDFLHLEARGEPAPFVLGKVYTDHFTPNERQAVKLAFQSMASRSSWQHVSQCFSD